MTVTPWAGRFVAIGDSFTEGVGDPNRHYPNGYRGWADRLARQLGRADPDWEYANLALRSRMLSEVVAHQLEPAIALQPTHVSFYAGGNDLLALRLDVDDLLARHDEAVARLAATGARVLVFTAFDTRTSGLLEPLRRRVLAYNDGVRATAARRGAQLIDHTLMREYEDPRLWAPDKIHMNRLGHKRMAAHVAGELGVPHTLRLAELDDVEPRPLRQLVAEEAAFVRGEVVPLVRRRISGRRPSDTAEAKWPEPIRPAEGMKRLARQRAVQAEPGQLRVSEKRERRAVRSVTGSGGQRSGARSPGLSRKGDTYSAQN